MDIREAAKIANEFLKDLIDDAVEIRFEEGIYRVDENVWQVTLSLIRVENDPESDDLGRKIKEYKVITINDSNDKILSVKKRLITRE